MYYYQILEQTFDIYLATSSAAVAKSVELWAAN
jgi:hypothetical protein